MRILLTGGSSFTGRWIAEALAEAGAEVTAPLRGEWAGRQPDRQARIAALGQVADVIPACPFGSEAFLALIREREPFDVLCLHHAEVGDFRRAGYAPLEAAQGTTAGIDAALQLLAGRGLRRLVHTGTVFEAEEGDGDKPLLPIGAYGQAKTLISQTIRRAAAEAGIAAVKVTIASPFGPEQSGGIVPGLLNRWCRGEAAFVEQPHWVRDFQPIAPLARHYAALATGSMTPARADRANPSGHVLKVLDFAERLAAGLRPRLDRACAVVANPRPLPRREPLQRFNTEPLAALRDEAAWQAELDRLANWAAATTARAA